MGLIHAALIAFAASPFAILGIGLTYVVLARRTSSPASPGEEVRPWYPRTPRWTPQADEAPTLTLGATAAQVEAWVAELAATVPDRPAMVQERKD